MGQKRGGACIKRAPAGIEGRTMKPWCLDFQECNLDKRHDFPQISGRRVHRNSNMKLTAYLLVLATMVRDVVKAGTDGCGRYCGTGPFSSAQETSSFSFRGLSVSVKLPVAGPDKDTSSAYSAPTRDHNTDQNGKFPIVFLFPGFLLDSSYYKEYCQRLGTWGFAVVQYNVPFMKQILPGFRLSIKQELDLFPGLLENLRQHEKGTLLDFSNIAVAGHSRGGKLAALHYAGNPSVKAAYLIDPVDCTQYQPESAENPSAQKALAASGKALGVCGAGVIGACNPDGGNYKGLYEVAGEGSWLTVVEGAGHAQFCNGWLNKLWDQCGGGPQSRKEVLALTLPGLVAWLMTHMPGEWGAEYVASVEASPAPAAVVAATALAVGEEVGTQHALASSDADFESFLEWCKAEQAAGQLVFKRK